MTKTIEVIVSPKGETTVQTKGFVGAECQLASKFIEQTLGIATDDRKTGEFYTTAQANQQVSQ